MHITWKSSFCREKSNLEVAKLLPSTFRTKRWVNPNKELKVENDQVNVVPLNHYHNETFTSMAAPWLIYTGNATLFNGGSLYNSKANTPWRCKSISCSNCLHLATESYAVLASHREYPLRPGHFQAFSTFFFGVEEWWSEG